MKTTTTTTTTTVGDFEDGCFDGTRKFDVVVCGGTLGILLAATLLQQKKHTKHKETKRSRHRTRETKGA